MVLKRISDFSRGWSSGEFSNHACGVLTAIREATVGAGLIVRTQRPHKFGRVRTTGKRTFGAQRALLGSRHKDNGKASKTHIDHLWRRLQRGQYARRCSDRAAPPLRNAHGQWGAHQRNLRESTQLWSPATWSARSMPPDTELGRQQLGRGRKAGPITLCLG